MGRHAEGAHLTGRAPEDRRCDRGVDAHAAASDTYTGGRRPCPACRSTPPDLEQVEAVVGDLDPTGNLIAVLQRLQQEFGYLPGAGDRRARPPQRGAGARASTASSRSTRSSRPTPSGRHKVCVCHGTACHVAGAGRITEALEQELRRRGRRHDRRHGVHPRLRRLHGRLLAGAGDARRRRDLRQSDGRPDARHRTRAASPGGPRGPSSDVGAPPSPQPRVGERLVSAAAPDRGVRVEVGRRRSGRRRISVCAGTACVFAGSLKIRDAFVEEVAAAGLGDEVDVRISGCHGLCSQGPLAVVSGDDTYYPRLKPRDVKRVVEEHLVGGSVGREAPVRRPRHRRARAPAPTTSPSTGSSGASSCATSACIDPESLDEYLARGGYEAARKALDHDDARGDHRRDPRLGPARPRRRRLPDRAEVEVRAARRRAT